jgi:hypothetical protein
LQVFSAASSGNIPSSADILRLLLQLRGKPNASATTGKLTLPALEQVCQIIAATSLANASRYLIKASLLLSRAVVEAGHRISSLARSNGVPAFRRAN